MKNLPRESCANCKFLVKWVPIKETDKNKGGWCHRFPPRGFASNYGVFPQVQEWDWCGEHKPKADR